MPTVVEEKVGGFAHCPDPRCEGYSQRPVDVIRTTVERTFVDGGGDLPGVENSFVYLHCAEEADVPCPSCGGVRELAEQPRRAYAALSGHPQDGLLGVARFDPAKVSAPKDEALEARLAALEQQNAALLKALGESGNVEEAS